VKRVAIPALLITLLPLPAMAALSPYYDSVDKIGTILGSSVVADALHQAPVRSIENTGTRDDGADEWVVHTQECDLVVYLKAVLPDGPGMTTYTLDLPKGCD
jgi:hypothetical protein